MRATRRRLQGFGLIELLVTIAIAGILLAFALPSLGSLSSESRATAITAEFAHALQTARSEAIKRSRPVVLCRSDDPFAAEPVCGGASYAAGWIVYADENANLAPDADEPVILQNGPAEASVDHGPAANVAARVRFDGSGAHVLDTGAPFRGTFALEVGGERRAIEVAASGRVSVVRP